MELNDAIIKVPGVDASRIRVNKVYEKKEPD